MVVYVEPYFRIRFGRVEYVRGHWRGLPSPAAASALRRASEARRWPCATLAMDG